MTSISLWGNGTFRARKVSSIESTLLKVLTRLLSCGSVSVDHPSCSTALKISSGKIARFADGSAVAALGSTNVLSAVVSRATGAPSGSFLPLIVDYRHKAAAGGHIPSNYFRRELGASDEELLVSRTIDRSLRPLFPSGYFFDTTVTCNLLSVDGVYDPEVAAINASSAALSLSDVPWFGPIGAARLSFVDGRVIVNPDRSQLSKSSMNLILVGTGGKKVVMAEMRSTFSDVSRWEIERCVDIGLEVIDQIVEKIQKLVEQCGKVKRETTLMVPEQDLIFRAEKDLSESVEEVFSDANHDKMSRDRSLALIRKEFTQKLEEEKFANDSESVGSPQLTAIAIENAIRNIYGKFVKNKNIRLDGRSPDQLRPITCEAGMYPPLHGCSLFQRGQTQVLSTTTFDSPQAAFRNNPISILAGGAKEKRFMLHYEFPAFSTNDLKPSSKRRELGHGALAEKALNPLVNLENNPFTVRVSCEVLESNGSSSMASVCAASLALMDAGVSLKKPVSGVAIGLTENILLADISGIEDYLGNMDFKIAGTKDGFTAMQLDLKVPGITRDMFLDSLDLAQKKNSEIIKIMSSTISEPRAQPKENGPVMKRITVPPQKRARLIGAGGYNLKRIESQTGCQINAVDEITFTLFAPNHQSFRDAQDAVSKELEKDREIELEFGAIYDATIVDITDSAVFVTLPGQPSDSKSIRISLRQLDQRPVSHPSALGFTVGQTFKVKYFGKDPQTGAIRLSRKVLHTITPRVRATSE